MQARCVRVLFVIGSACSDAPRPPAMKHAPLRPSPDASFVLGAAGAPSPLFGPEHAPTFAAGFASLAETGFNRFTPIFLTSESGAGTAHTVYFLPSDVPGVSDELSCTSAYNPWRALPAGLTITFPAYLAVVDQEMTQPLDGALARARLSALVAKCLDGDTTKIGEAYLYDEPATNYIAAVFDNKPPFDVANVATLAAAARDVLQQPTLVVEAPTPFVLDINNLPPQQHADLEAKFWAQVDAITPHADSYGFDVYPIDLLDDVSLIGEYVGYARARAPHARSIAVLQSFGAKDMMIDVGTAGRRPTRAESRAMALYALASGARDIYWYGASALVLGDGPLWDDIRELVRDLRALSGVFAGASRSVAVGNTKVAAASWTLAAGTWFVIANPTPYAQSIELLFDETSDVFDALDEALLAADVATWQRELAAYESVVIATRAAE